MNSHVSYPRLILLMCGLINISLPRLSAEPINLGSRRELFVDRHLIEKLDGAQLAFDEQAECETRLLWSQLATGNRKGAVAPLHLDVSTLHRETQIQC